MSQTIRIEDTTIKALTDRIKELEAENQRLRELGNAVVDQLDECRSQLVALLLQEQGE